MVSNYKRTQWVVLGAMVLMAGFLFTRDVTGLVKPSAENGKTNGRETEMPAAGGSGTPMAAGNAPEGHQLSVEQVSAVAKGELSAERLKVIEDLEKQYARATADKKDALAVKLAAAWEDVEQSGPSAMYLEQLALTSQKAADYERAGDRFLKAYDLTADTLMQPGYLQKANVNYDKALKLDTGNLNAKIGLGTTIVNGMGAPMSGIALLREVAAKDPENVKVNMQLGIFSLKSGQFGKAAERFNTVLKKKKTADVYFYLGTAYENMNKNAEAVTAYENSRKIAGNAKLNDFLDKKIAELKMKM